MGKKMEDRERFLCLGLVMRDILLENVQGLPADWEQTILAEGVKEDVGGGAANSARTLARLGADIAIAGMVGNDPMGDRIVQILQAEGVDTALLARSARASTGVAVGLVKEGGERCFITSRGCNASLSRTDIQGTEDRTYEVVHVNGYFQFPSLEQDLPGMLRTYREKGSLIAFDTASSDPSGRWFEAIRPLAGSIDYFFANTAQLRSLGGREGYRGNAAFLLEQGIGCVVVKRGHLGCAVVTQEKEWVIEGYPVEAIDTTGAGDSFDAAFMLGVAKGRDMTWCGQFANVVAACNCRAAGGTGGVPDYSTAIGLMQYYGRERIRKCHW